MSGRYRDRVDAGRRLAALVEQLELADPVILGLPRGGVPVAFEVSERLGAPLDVVVVRKVGAPRQPELAIGAVAEDDEVLIDDAAARAVGADRATIDELVSRERLQMTQGVARFRNGRALPALGGRDVVVIDDGLATGLTARVALRVARRHGPRTLMLAVPVGAMDSVGGLREVADDVICVLTPSRFLAVGLWYQRFGQTSDEEVLSLLSRSRRLPGSPAPPGRG